MRAVLDRLLARRLPRVDVAFVLGDAVGRLASRYAQERKALVTGVPGRDDSAGEVLRVLPRALVVFALAGAGGGEVELRREERRLVELAQGRDISVRVVAVATSGAAVAGAGPAPV